ncbi:MAG TPA: hypothetical protein VL728_18030 [Cyclobacteriaceae bacterium]|jgi:hypothetical protein|nr:hypothetical protein [Cyclobacteriaceae bacterium]
MDSKHIEELLEKYWNAETTLEQEEELRVFFQGNDIPENMSETATLFRYFENEKSKNLSEKFDADVTKKVQQRQGGKIVAMKDWFRMARVAAGIIVVVAAVFLIGKQVREKGEMVDTQSDPKLAFEETKKALMMISKNFHKAQKEASMINLLNEAEQTIQKKPSEKKEEDKKVNI